MCWRTLIAMLAVLLSSAVGAGQARAHGLRVTGDAAGIHEDAHLAWDVRGRVISDALRFALRARDQEALGFGDIALESRVRVIAGDLAIQWATGRILGEPSAFAPFGRRESSPGADLLWMAGTTVAREAQRRGGIVRLPAGPVMAAVWSTTAGAGACLASGPLGCAVARLQPHGVWRWSVAASWSSSRGAAPADTLGATDEDVAPEAPLAVSWSAARGASRSRDGVVLELAGDLAGSRSEGARDLARPGIMAGGTWAIGLAPALGAIEGSFQWSALPADARSTGDDVEGWFLRWALPWVRAASPSLVWVTRRQPAPRAAHATLGRELRVELKAAPWSGAVLGLNIRGENREECGAGAEAGSTRRFVERVASQIELRADICFTHAARLEARFRRQAIGRALSSRATSIWEAARGDEVEAEGADAVEPETAFALEDEGELASVQLHWESRASWGGGSWASSPLGYGGASFIPVRHPCGHTRWRPLGAGHWMAQLWLGRALGPARVEGVLRLTSEGSGAESIEATWLLGAAWSIARSGGGR
jgi:hypothetical protein